MLISQTQTDEVKPEQPDKSHVGGYLSTKYIKSEQGKELFVNLVEEKSSVVKKSQTCLLSTSSLC